MSLPDGESLLPLRSDSRIRQYSPRRYGQLAIACVAVIGVAWAFVEHRPDGLTGFIAIFTGFAALLLLPMLAFSFVRRSTEVVVRDDGVQVRQVLPWHATTHDLTWSEIRFVKTVEGSRAGFLAIGFERDRIASFARSAHIAVLQGETQLSCEYLAEVIIAAANASGVETEYQKWYSYVPQTTPWGGVVFDGIGTRRLVRKWRFAATP